MASKKKRMAANPLDEIIPETTKKKSPKEDNKKSPNRIKKKSVKGDTKEKKAKISKKADTNTTPSKKEAPRGDSKKDNKRPEATMLKRTKEKHISKSSWPKVGFRFRPDLMELLNWAVYCTGKNKQEILNEALETYLDSLDLPKMPEIEKK